MCILVCTLVSCSRQTTININTLDFSEKFGSSTIEISDSAKHSINNYMESLYIETDTYAGFSKNPPLFDFEEIHALYRFYEYYNQIDGLNKVKDYVNKNIYIVLNNIDNLDYLNFLYFFDLTQKLNIDIPLDTIEYMLEQNFDKDNNLFYMVDIDDNIGMKLIATSLTYDMIKGVPELTEIYLDSISNGIINELERSTFSLPNNGSTLYNSGGNVLYAASNLGIEIKDIEALYPWFSSWKSFIESSNNLTLSQYVSFIKVGELFDDNINKELLQALTQNYLDSNDSYDIELIFDINQYFDIESNIDGFSLLKSKTVLMFDTISVIKQNIDLESTFYGIMLAYYTGFDVDELKLKNTLNQYVLLIESEYDVNKLIHYLYYVTMLDQILNHMHISIDDGLIIEKIEYVVNNATRLENITMSVEILSALSKDTKINVSKDVINLSIEYANLALNEKENESSFYINEAIIILYIFQQEIDIDKIVIMQDNLIQLDGSFKYSSYLDNGDIISTFNILRTTDITNVYDYIKYNKQYVEDCLTEDGFFTVNTFNDYYNLASIYYGYVIAGLNVQIDKGDIE